MNKIIKLFLIIIALHSCSYEPILTKKNYDFQFIEIKYEGDKNINKEIERNLRNFGKGVIRYNIFFKTKKIKEIISSDSKGDPKIYKINIYIEYIVSNKDQTILKNNTNRQFTYNNINDKYELSKYEDNLLKNLSNNISEDILFSLKVLK
tara:strand:+ start:398 stop:847 length:450 start_codon:yes stop_codon:yes gene_type:complete